MMKFKHCISVLTKSSLKKEKKIELESSQRESHVYSKNSNIANKISSPNSHIAEITTLNNHIEEITTHNGHINDNVTDTEDRKQTKNESEDLKKLLQVFSDKNNQLKNGFVSTRGIPCDSTSNNFDIIKSEEINETNPKICNSESEETSINKDTNSTSNPERISVEKQSEEYSEMRVGELTDENNDEKISSSLQLNDEIEIISENENALQCVIPILNICLKTEDPDYSKVSNLQKDNNMQHKNSYLSSRNKTIKNENSPLFDKNRLQPTHKSFRRYFKCDGYILLNTCQSGDKPPLPEKQSEVVVKFKESFERVETCHSSLPRRRAQNHSSFQTTSESMLNTIIKPASSLQFPPPIPARNLCKSNINSKNENTRSENIRKNERNEAISFVQSSSSFNENMHSHLFDFQNKNEEDCNLIKKTDQNMFLAQRKMKKHFLERSSLFCIRDSDGYLICDSWKNEGKNITSAENLTNRYYRNELNLKGNSFSKIKNNKCNQTIDMPSRYAKYTDTQEFIRENHPKEHLQNLLLTSVPLSKKSINRFHSHSNTQSNSKAFLTSMTRSFTSDCATRENPLKEMENNKSLFNQNSNLWRENKKREHSGNFEVNYLQLDMVSPLSSAISASSPCSTYSNYRKIDWYKTKALTNIRYNRSNEQDQF